jgi:glutaredoxin
MNNISSPRPVLFYVRRILGAVLLLALSATFLYSAYTKAGVEFQGFHLVQNDNSFDSFQWTFLDLGVNSILAAGIIARVFIGLELVLGLFLLFHVFLKRFTYPAVITILSIFIVYLLIVILKQGNTGNCGCFGDKLAMKPLTAIWKNVAMIAVTVLLMFIYPVKPYKNQEFVCLILGLVAFSAPFLANHVYTGTAPEPYHKTIDLNLLYKYDPAPSVDLRTGKHIIAFMSLTCPHCKKAAYLLHIIRQQHPDIPVFMVLDGADEFKKQFFDETHAENVPYLFYKHSEEFIQMAGEGVPSIIWVNNGITEYKSVWAYYQLDPSFMQHWLIASDTKAISPEKK